VASTGASLGSAWVQVTADASDVAGSLKDDVTDAVKQIARIFEAAFGQVEDDASTAATTVGETLGEGAREGSQNMSREMDGGGGAFVDKVKGVAALAAAAFGAAFVVGNYLDLDNASAMLDAQLGGMGEQAGLAGKVAGEIYANNFGDSMDQVSEATKLVVQGLHIGLTADAFQPVTEGILSVSNAFGQDLQPTVNAVAQLMRTGLAPDAQSALDIITRGFQEGAGQTDDYLDTLNEYSVQFQKLGIDGTTATGLLVQGLQAGARNTDLVADAFKEFSIRAIDGSKTTADAYAAIGLDAQTMGERIGAGGESASAALNDTLTALRNMEDPVARSQAAVGLFGTQAEDLGSALYALDPATAGAVGDLEDTKGAAEGLANTLGDTVSSKVEGVKRAIGGFANDTLNSLITGFTSGKSSGEGFQGAMSDLGSTVKTITGWLSDHSTTVQIVAGVIGGIMLPILAAWGVASVVNGAKSVAAWFSTALSSQTSAAAQERSAAQVGLSWLAMGIQATIQAIRIAVVWLAQTAVAAGGVVVGWVVGAARTVAAWVLMGAQALVQGARIAAVWIAQTAAAIGPMLISWGIAVGAVVAGWVMMGVESLIRAAQMAAAWLIAMGPIGWIIAAVIGLVALIIANWDNIKNFTVGVFQAIWGFIQMVWNGIVGGISAALSWIWGVITSVFGAVWGFISGLFTGIWNFIVGVWQGIGSAIKGALDWIWGVISGAFTTIRDFVSGIFSGIAGAVKGAWDAVGNAIKSAINWIIDLVNKFVIGGVNVLIDGINFVNPFDDIPHVPSIPHLAYGAIIDRPTLALVGEAGPEVVVPLSPARANRRNALMDEAGLSDGSGTRIDARQYYSVRDTQTAEEVGAIIGQRVVHDVRNGITGAYAGTGSAA
jgi:hypothetical protein